ncbi:hypothetical protein [Hyphomicrobium sp. 802]|uniref:hypothetical protein n=1 Tax=Hyphomicrobium sp. 802 TaxID=1112272 RepID=UPI0012DD463E|nr:hypothetical protein [Hyphomicrobium sp. 802]
MTENHARKDPREVSREELYRQVWQTPMSRLALEYGISGNGLAKICNRLKVPYPKRGYWARKAAGQKVIAFRLPPGDKDTPQSVTITPTPQPSQPQKLPDEVQIKSETARAEATAIAVSDRLLRPHPIIARWLAEHDRKRREARLERDPWRKNLLKPTDWSESDRRRHRILDALFKGMEKQGARVQQDDRRQLFFEVNDEKIEFQIREKQKQTRRPLNESEQRWRIPGDSDWRRELQPTGKLAFSIKTYLPGNLRREWLETDKKTMESLLPDVIATLVAAGPLLVERRKQREEEERQRRIAEQKRYEEQQQKKLDDNRWRRFVELAMQRREAETARQFLNALKSLDIDQQHEIAGHSIADWISWVEQRLLRADPLNHGADAIFESISQVATWTYRD